MTRSYLAVAATPKATKPARANGNNTSRQHQQAQGTKPHATRAAIVNPLFDRTVKGSTASKSRETPSETEAEFRRIFNTSLKPPPSDPLLDSKTKEFLYDPTARSIARVAAGLPDHTPATLLTTQMPGYTAETVPLDVLDDAVTLYYKVRTKTCTFSMQNVIDLTNDYLAGLAMLYEQHTRSLFAATRVLNDLHTKTLASHDVVFTPAFCNHCGGTISRIDETHPLTCPVLIRKKQQQEEVKRNQEAARRMEYRHAVSDLETEHRTALTIEYTRWEQRHKAITCSFLEKMPKSNHPTQPPVQAPRGEGRAPTAGAKANAHETERPRVSGGKRRSSVTSMCSACSHEEGGLDPCVSPPPETVKRTDRTSRKSSSN